jgi:hypothetical protein
MAITAALRSVSDWIAAFSSMGIGVFMGSS